jgi:hypothetical protein
MNHVINFRAELEKVTDYWSPRVVGRVNDQPDYPDIPSKISQAIAIYG